MVKGGVDVIEVISLNEFFEERWLYSVSAYE